MNIVNIIIVPTFLNHWGVKSEYYPPNKNKNVSGIWESSDKLKSVFNMSMMIPYSLEHEIDSKIITIYIFI